MIGKKLEINEGMYSKALNEYWENIDGICVKLVQILKESLRISKINIWLISSRRSRERGQPIKKNLEYLLKGLENE